MWHIEGKALTHRLTDRLPAVTGCHGTEGSVRVQAAEQGAA